jgi:hypothetical protein
MHLWSLAILHPASRQVVGKRRRATFPMLTSQKRQQQRSPPNERSVLIRCPTQYAYPATLSCPLGLIGTGLDRPPFDC